MLQKINILVVGLTDAPNRKVLLDISGRENFILINETNESLITFFKQQLCSEKTMQRQTRRANIGENLQNSIVRAALTDFIRTEKMLMFT